MPDLNYDGDLESRSHGEEKTSGQRTTVEPVSDAATELITVDAALEKSLKRKLDTR